MAFKKKAEEERQQIGNDIKRCQGEAKATKKEIVTVGQLKAEVESHGLSLKLAIDLCKEFAGHENAREELSRALTERRTITE